MFDSIKKSFRDGSQYRIFLFAVIAFGLAYGLYKGVLDNYLAETVGMSEFDKGVSEFFRELPGLLLVFILAVFYMLSAETLYKIGSFITLAGMLAHAVIPANKVIVIAAVCFFSIGEHIQLGMRNTMTLEYSGKGSSGQALGWMNSMNRAGNLLGFFIISFAFMFVSGAAAYRVTFAISAAIIAVGAFLTTKLSGNIEQDKTKSRFYFRKKYVKYYCLEVFYGARKQVFFTFGPFVLILFYGASTSTISLLFAISSIAGFLISPVIGRLIDRVGYKTVMIADTLILVIVCFFYGFAHHIFPMEAAFIVCCVNYVLDSIISLASMASNVYVQDLADSAEEARATISTGLSVNHLITIIIALFGGWIWKALGIETLFVLSAVLGLCNSAYAASIRVPKKS